MDKTEIEKVLDLPLPESNNLNDSETIREALWRLLYTLYNITDSFSGKRPFGNSGWDYEFLPPLIRAGYVVGELDEDGYLEDIDYGEKAKAEDIIFQCIRYAFFPKEFGG